MLIVTRICRFCAVQVKHRSVRSASTTCVGVGDKRTVAVAMSGGIDSAVAALLLQDQGYNCVGVFMKNWDPSDECGSESCDISVDYKDMVEVCKRLNIPSYEVNFVKEYWNEVFAPFLDSYKTGIETPNPDAFCNRFVKFKHFRKFVTNKLGIDTIATGHYSQMVPTPATTAAERGASKAAQEGLRGFQMLKGVDPLKDQSYFLALTQGSALQKVLFPIGHLTKAEVKAIAAQRLPGLKVLSKPESMGICFIGKRDMRDFLEDYITLTSGRFIDLDTGAVVGVHDGFEYYTIGQKARISGVVHKYYVVGKRKNMIRGTTGDFVTSSDAKETKKSTGSGGVLKPSLHSELIMLQGKLDALNNTKEVGWKISGDVYVVNDINHIALNSPYITQPLSAINWIAGCAPLELLDTLQRDSLSGTSTEQQPPLPRSYRCECKVRYLQLPTQCSIQLYKGAPYSSAHRMNPAGNHRNTTGSGSVDQQQQEQEEIMMKITFDIPQRAITPGQIIALYDGEVVLGGGVIAEQPLPEGK